MDSAAENRLREWLEEDALPTFQTADLSTVPAIHTDEILDRKPEDNHEKLEVTIDAFVLLSETLRSREIAAHIRAMIPLEPPEEDSSEAPESPRSHAEIENQLYLMPEIYLLREAPQPSRKESLDSAAVVLIPMNVDLLTVAVPGARLCQVYWTEHEYRFLVLDVDA